MSFNNKVKIENANNKNNLEKNKSNQPSIKKSIVKLEKKKVPKKDDNNFSNNLSKELPLQIGNNLGECPNKMVLMLYDVKKKKPFMIKLNISISSIHIFKIMEWSKNQNIDFSYIKNNLHIIMYAYTFFENNYEHKLTICNDKITNEAMQECKNKNLIPYNNDNKNTSNEIINEYTFLKEIISKKLIFDNNNTKIIILNDLLLDFIKKIINKMKLLKKKIKVKNFGNIIDIRDTTIFENLLLTSLQHLF